ncbi:starch-binding protein [Bacteroidia bacterium]|nr:starch-binding protein [Bacteroidia bacterium]
MKNINIRYWTAAAILTLTSVACVKLDQTPLSSLPAENYFNSDAQLQSYVNNLYTPRTGSNSNDQTFDVHGTYNYGTFAIDNNTDNMASKGNGDDRWILANNKVGQTGGDWSFSYIYKVNYFFRYALPKYEAGTISGSEANVKQAIGEAYFLRAYEYFKRLQNVGDYPIITDLLQDDMDVLIEQSKRRPRTDVARFILSDLDNAIELLGDGVATTRITKKAALLFKSRVALFEGTWLKYFQGTAFVPNGDGWPGATKDYNAGWQYEAGDIVAEYNWFLGEAMTAAQEVADNTPLTANTGIVPQAAGQTNPYLEMFGAVDLNAYPEVLFWRQYDLGLGITHNVPQYTHSGCQGIGLTRGYVDNFLMADGTPAYASSDYAGDDYIDSVVVKRDNRLQIFLKVPGQLNYFLPGATPARATPTEPYPDITEGNAERGYSTGYTLRKGINFTDREHYIKNNEATTGSIVFRAVEAYLNYMEAVYERDGVLDGKAAGYWTDIRNRANPDSSSSYATTIAATNIAQEINNDWAAFSAGAPLADLTLYNIRRERRMELMAEGLRMMDMKRWRALDQLVGNPYHIEGFKLWGPMKNWYASLKPGDNVSPSSASAYLRPYEANPNSAIAQQGGYLWRMAHYLSPIAAEHFLVSSSDGSTVSTSPIYQNPYWSTRANETATK